jgi:hypothetical protein
VSETAQTGLTLTLQRFWRWLAEHPNCILRAGSADAYLYDQDEFHWHVHEDRSGLPRIQLIWGKRLIGEIVLDTRDVLYVQATPYAEVGEPEGVLFELIAGQAGNTFSIYQFVLAHTFEEEGGHDRFIH